jgi:hypothetical protein
MRAGLTTLTQQAALYKYRTDLLHTRRRFHYDIPSITQISTTSGSC